MALLRLRRGAPRGLTPDERRCARGARSLADLVAPGAFDVARDHARLDQQYVRTVVVTGYPRTVAPGWLQPLVDFEEPLELSLHLHPLEAGPMVRTLTHKMVQLHSSRLFEARGGKLADPEREVAYGDAERLRDALQRGDERVFSVSFYVLLRASSPKELDDLTRRVEVTLDGMLAQSRVAVWEQDAGFRSCLPEATDHLLVYRNLDTSSLATTFPFSSSSLAMERGVLYGIARHNHSPVIVDPFDPRRSSRPGNRRGRSVGRRGGCAGGP
jgi:conjugal transfer ATP-binding protein TraC